jgi:hypothetical protein
MSFSDPEVYSGAVRHCSTNSGGGVMSVIELLDSGEGWAKAFQKTHHAPVAFTALNSAADMVFVRAVLGTHNLFLSDFKIEKVSHPLFR